MLRVKPHTGVFEQKTMFEVNLTKILRSGVTRLTSHTFIGSTLAFGNDNNYYKHDNVKINIGCTYFICVTFSLSEKVVDSVQ